jgi:nitroimidazol reductase NimA-like FMN-containing flavoprotein (pyridoxamine 5'-phosphate oxidase superfamily)
MAPPPPTDGDAGQPASDRVQLRRGAHLGRYRADDVRAILDAGVIAHVGVTTPTGPVVIPMAYGYDDRDLYLHGSVANAALRAADGQDVCVTVTVVDGLIFGRSAFHNSMQYRSVVVRGRATRVLDEAAHRRGLQLVTDHVTPNWETARPPTTSEVRKTMIVTVPLTEASAKVRTGGPADEPEDLAGPHWGGSVPIHTTFGAPVPSPDLPDGVAVPDRIAALRGRPVHPSDVSRATA